jgi:hypothetical protein
LPVGAHISINKLVKKLLSGILPHFDKADTAFKVINIVYKVVMLLRAELAAVLDDKTPPPGASPALAV